MKKYKAIQSDAKSYKRKTIHITLHTIYGANPKYNLKMIGKAKPVAYKTIN